MHEAGACAPGWSGSVWSEMHLRCASGQQLEGAAGLDGWGLTAPFSCQLPDLVMLSCSLNTWKTEAGGWELQASLGYSVKPCHRSKIVKANFLD